MTERTQTQTEQIETEEFAAGFAAGLAAGTKPSLRCDATGTKRACYHLVVKGDTLTGIAAKYKVNYPADIKRWNPEFFKSPRKPDLIYPGDKVTIKKAGAA